MKKKIRLSSEVSKMITAAEKQAEVIKNQQSVYSDLVKIMDKSPKGSINFTNDQIRRMKDAVIAVNKDAETKYLSW